MPKNANISKVLIQFYSTSRSKRLDYILNYVFKTRLGLDFELVYDPSMLKPNCTTFVYSKEKLFEGIHVTPDGLLSEDQIKSDVPMHTMFIQDHHKVDKTSYPDLFSAIFYHLSRYEEYQGPKDALGRFNYHNSCLFLHNKLETPVVDEWIFEFKTYLITCHGFKNTEFKLEQFHTQASIDIDSVFSYKGRGVMRSLAAIAKDLLNFNFSEIRKRLSVLIGLKDDPNDNFNLQEQLLNGSKAWYFIQVGKYGKLDKNIKAQNTEFKKIICKLHERQHQIGLHPSFGSNGLMPILNQEKNTLQNIVGEEIKHSRQHYLKFELPQTFNALLQIGIQNDYSMGYSEIAGFRAGTACPFYWYDLKNESITSLLIHPFAVMDVAYKNFLKMSIEDAIIASGKIKDNCRRLNAPFVFVFHNESLSNHRGWENWDKVFSFWNHE